MQTSQKNLRVLIVGKPNSGKSLLFNRLTGLRQKVANFSGVTVDIKTAPSDSGDILYTDYPGVYSLHPVTEDEKCVVDSFHQSLKEDQVSAVLCLLDATRLERSLIFGLQVQKAARQHNKAVVFALNMIDEITEHGLSIDVQQMSEELGSPVVAISAQKKQNLNHLKKVIHQILACPQDYLPKVPPKLDIFKKSKKVHKLFFSNQTQSQTQIQTQNQNIKKQAVNHKSHKRIKNIKRPKVTHQDVILKKQNRFDEFFLSRFGGGIFFVIIMAFLFQSIFTWATPAMDFVESSVAFLGHLTASILPKGILRDFTNDALFGGIGSFLVFVPQIFILTFIIGFLEDSGYLARAVVICHKPLSLVGLSGKSFVPFLSGHACAIPAIFAARNITSPKKRILTMLTIPLMACSARLPVYALFVAALIPPITYFGGLMGMQGLAFFALYVFGIITALLVSMLLSQTFYKHTTDIPFVVELPPYRFPSMLPLLRHSFYSAWSFMKKAGGIIFCTVVVIWVLGYFPSQDLETSWLAQIGKWIEPIFDPLGLDWKFSVAILTSFLAREVFVGTLGTLFNIQDTDENISALSDQIVAEVSLASGLSLLVFYAIALQCVSTVAILKKEFGSYKAPVLVFAFYGFLAYVFALITYQILI